jgi:muramoyltetrapeptide carboxypeptidase
MSEIMSKKWLKPGDLLRVIAPSSYLKEFEEFNQGLEIWRGRGYQVEISPGFDDQWGYLAGTDESRLRQFTDAFNDPECRGILCARGGYGCIRLLEMWQREKLPITNYPLPITNYQSPPSKWLIGFSDITTLLWSQIHLGIWGVHGPMLTTISAEPEWSIERLFDCVEGRNLQPLQGKGWGGGKASGLLLPANLTLATHLLGTPYQPDLTNVILAFEDTKETPYRLDRMLTQWRLMENFSGVKGIALGRFSDCEPSPGKISFTVEEVLRDRLGNLNIPIVSDLAFGHDGPNATLPVGIVAHLDADSGTLDFMQS